MILLLVYPVSNAWADGGSSTVRVPTEQRAGCTVTAGTDGSFPLRLERPSAAGGDGWRNLHRLAWQTGALHRFDLGMDGFERLLLESRHRLSTAPVGYRRPTSRLRPGAWFLFTCLGSFPGTGGGPCGSDDGRPSHATADARGAGASGREPAQPSRPAIETSPSGEQLVNVPTWLWLARSAWAPVTRDGVGAGRVGYGDCAALDGHLDARRRKLCCARDRDPYAPGGDPSASSPDCGHTYRRSSAGQPGTLRVSATVTWGVTWEGAARSARCRAHNNDHGDFRVSPSRKRSTHPRPGHDVTMSEEAM